MNWALTSTLRTLPTLERGRSGQTSTCLGVLTLPSRSLTKTRISSPATLARAEQVARVVHDGHRGERGRPPGRGQALGGDGAVVAEVFGGRQRGDHHRGLGLAEQLAHDRADPR